MLEDPLVSPRTIPESPTTSSFSTTTTTISGQNSSTSTGLTKATASQKLFTAKGAMNLRARKKDWIQAHSQVRLSAHLLSVVSLGEPPPPQGFHLLTLKF